MKNHDEQNIILLNKHRLSLSFHICKSKDSPNFAGWFVQWNKGTVANISGNLSPSQSSLNDGHCFLAARWWVESTGSSTRLRGFKSQLAVYQPSDLEQVILCLFAWGYLQTRSGVGSFLNSLLTFFFFFLQQCSLLLVQKFSLNLLFWLGCLLLASFTLWKHYFCGSTCN